jgi:hypothetical protein
MKLAKAIFVTSTEAPGRNDRVAFLQSTQPERRDCYVADLWLGELGVMAGDELYPLHMFRRLTVDSLLEAMCESTSSAREAFVGAMERDYSELKNETISDEPIDPLNIAKLNIASKSQKRRGRPPKAR